MLAARHDDDDDDDDDDDFGNAFLCKLSKASDKKDIYMFVNIQFNMCDWMPVRMNIVLSRGAVKYAKGISAEG